MSNGNRISVMTKQFTIITKYGSKWLTVVPSKPIWGNEKEWMEEVLSEDLPYIGNRPEGTVLDESEVREVRQYRKICASHEWMDMGTRASPSPWNGLPASDSNLTPICRG